MKEYVVTPPDNSANQVLYKMLRETQNNQMIWTVCTVVIDLIEVRGRPIGYAYISRLKGQCIRIYKVWNSDRSTEQVILEIYNEVNHIVIWRFPETNIISDLYRMVESKYSQVNSLFQQYLSE